MDDLPAALVERAKLALTALRQGDDDGALEFAAIETRELVMLLFAECSAMIAALGNGGAIPVKVQVFDSDGTEVSIDEADPPVRTAVRTLLAEVHGNRADATAQIEIAMANASRDEVNSLALQAMRWTLRLAGECADRDLTVAPWIAEALA